MLLRGVEDLFLTTILPPVRLCALIPVIGNAGFGSVFELLKTKYYRLFEWVCMGDRRWQQLPSAESDGYKRWLVSVIALSCGMKSQVWEW